MTLALIRRVKDGNDLYHAIVIWCPGCQKTDSEGRIYGGLHMLPVSGDKQKRPVWGWNGKLEKVTLSPSILTKGGPDKKFVCHSFLEDGIWKFLGDCTHSMKNKHVSMVPLPDWVTKELERNGT